MTGSAFIEHFRGLTNAQLLRAKGSIDEAEHYLPPQYFDESALAVVRSIYIFDEMKRRGFHDNQKGV